MGPKTRLKRQIFLLPKTSDNITENQLPTNLDKKPAEQFSNIQIDVSKLCKYKYGDNEDLDRMAKESLKVITKVLTVGEIPRGDYQELAMLIKFYLSPEDFDLKLREMKDGKRSLVATLINVDNDEILFQSGEEKMILNFVDLDLCRLKPNFEELMRVDK